MQIQDYIEKTASQILKEEFREVREDLRKRFLVKIGDFRSYVIALHPEYDSQAGAGKIQTAWNMYGGDVLLTRLIKQYRDHLNSTAQ